MRMFCWVSLLGNVDLCCFLLSAWQNGRAWKCWHAIAASCGSDVFAAVFTRGTLQCFKSHFVRAVAALLPLLKSTKHTPRSLSGWRSAAEVAKFTDRLSATAASYRCARLFANPCECSVRDVPAGCISCSWCCIYRKIGQFWSWFMRDKKSPSGFSQPGVRTNLTPR